MEINLVSRYFHLLKSIILFFIYLNPSHGKESWIMVNVDTDKSVATVDPKFISVAIDSGMAALQWEGFNFSSIRLRTLARGLSPAYLRLGGSSADYTVFDDTHTKVDWKLLCKCFNVSESCPQKTKPTIKLTRKYWNLFNKFAMDSKMEVLADLNLLLRDKLTCGVNLTNVIRLLDYSHQRGYSKNLHFEMGNEPDIYHDFGFMIDGVQNGNDISMLRSLLSTPPVKQWYSRSLLVGPDTTKDVNYISEYINSKGGQSIDSITYHHYNVHAETASVADFVNPDIYDAYAKLSADVREIVHKSKHPNLTVWLGESNTGWGAGKLGLTDTYVNGLMWLDKLGVSAKMDTKVVIRQTFYGYNYSLIDHHFNPLPDYWLMLLHKRLVGQRVLSAKTNIAGEESKWVRAYAHCTKDDSFYKKGSVTLFIINLRNTTINLWLGGIMAQHSLDEYLMTPGNEDVLSRKVYLNGIRLEMKSDTELPYLPPRHLPPLSTASIPPHTYAFYVLPDAQVKVCS